VDVPELFFLALPLKAKISSSLTHLISINYLPQTHTTVPDYAVLNIYLEVMFYHQQAFILLIQMQRLIR
jgi:hypothetical protein